MLERLASSYLRLIAVHDNSMVHVAAWIREDAGIGASQQVRFGHFVTWLVKQHPAATHRASSGETRAAPTKSARDVALSEGAPIIILRPQRGRRCNQG